MDDIQLSIKRYVKDVLYKRSELVNYIESASIILTENEVGFVWDIMLLLENDLFRHEFTHLYSDCFVVDDHDHDPWVFTRVKSYDWLRQDFSQRLSIALWIFGSSLVIQDPDKKFIQIIKEHQKEFSNSVNDILKQKYLEFRTERHNLRHALAKDRRLAISMIKASMGKLALEMCLLSESKPYPYKKWLPEIAVRETTNGIHVASIVKKFFKNSDTKKTIELSENLVQLIISFLKKTNKFSDDFLNNWWLYLA